MDTRRQLRMAQLLQEEFGQMLLTDIREYLLGSFCTLTHVRVTPDMSLVRVNISVMNYEDKQEVIENLIMHKSEIRKILGQRMRNHMRKIPDLEFYLDTTLDYVENINNLLKNIDPANTMSDGTKD